MFDAILMLACEHAAPVDQLRFGAFAIQYRLRQRYSKSIIFYAARSGLSIVIKR